MKNRKTIIFILLFVLFAGIFLHRGIQIYRAQNSIDQKEARSVDNNKAKEITLEAGKSYTVGQGGFKAGYYDIIAKENTSTNFFGLVTGQKILNRYFYEGNRIDIEGKGAVLLKPSQFEPIQFHEGKAILKNIRGYFEVGKEIPAGTYRISIVKHGEAIFAVQRSNLGMDKPVSYTHLDVYKRQVFIPFFSVIL